MLLFSKIWRLFSSPWKQVVNLTYVTIKSVQFKSHFQEVCNLKIQNNVFGKNQDYNTAMPRQEKCSGAESWLKEFLDKKTPHSSN